ncbi:MAG: radical SAM protein [Theionarchaea archaeon]|nr:radical SAM protein [Theionarchaea archaeon]MBU7001842.1 radical SAM protein [Theionarchaea archaeon]MBU7020946.1 radical SAM protein [Theionarchaea archaeon]MBU7033999.1 radical SAM protein [Theionarchaea archaeon]MBU7041047.1 radical SAM protein [Theionarchaea archaeon]
MYSPVERALHVQDMVSSGDKRKYYRFRPAPFYGGIATADCVGCPLTCVFCWSGFPRDHPEKAGDWYSSQQVFDELVSIAKKKRYSSLRVSGNEPTLGQEHLINVLKRVEKTPYQFILETSGILIDDQYAKALSNFKNVHVRVSLKGACEEEFTHLTGCDPEGFKMQLLALQNLKKHGVPCHPAVMVSFSTPEKVEELIGRLSYISSSFYVEEEHVMLYPLVKRRLRKAGFLP